MSSLFLISSEVSFFLPVCLSVYIFYSGMTHNNMNIMVEWVPITLYIYYEIMFRS